MSLRSSSPAPDVRAIINRRTACSAVLLAVLAAGSGAQTIGEYSEAQRKALQAEIVKANATGAANAASAAGAAASAPPVRLAQQPQPRPRPAPPAKPPEPVLQVAGVSEVRGSLVAEVTVNGQAFMTRVGERVPGTTWHVRSLSVDSVTLAGAPKTLRTGRTTKTVDGPTRVVYLAPIARTASRGAGGAAL